jgi:3-hydroxy acid dehydrogenase/malonic semialdehyde reductase
MKNITLVTGASSGIGQALARELVSQGHLVIGLARSSEKLMALKNELGSTFIPITCDVSSQSDIRRASQYILDQGLCPTIFFLNAGMAGEKVIEDPENFKVQMHERIMAVNYFGVLAFVEFFEKPCLENGGAHFIVTSSVNAVFAPPTGSAYCASKAAISKAFESLSLTYFEKNLRFSSIYPGPVATNGLKGDWPFTWGLKKWQSICAISLRAKNHGDTPLFFTS